MKRHQQILAGLLVLQLILTGVVFWPKPATTGAGALLFSDVTLDEIVSLAIADDQGREIVLEKRDETWVMPEAGDYPARSASITSTLSKTLQLKTGAVVAHTPGSHTQLKVAENDFVRRVIFETSEGRAYILYLGSSPSYGATHIRLEGQDETYLVRDLTVYDFSATATSWVDTEYFSVPSAEVTGMTVENAAGTLRFVKEGDAWTLEDLGEDEEVDTGQINTLLNRATSVRMTRPLGKTETSAYGMEQPNATVIVVMTDTTYTLTIGAHDTDAGTYVVKASNSPYYVAVSDVNMERFVDAVREQFLVEEPTPTPTPASEE
ncbi:MAG: DUF4340 domain-containing protein [Anaerolineae bacterium]